MKKFKTALVSLALCGALTIGASAAQFTASADHLKTLGLFAGTNQGYELDRAPTRAEAATMLVRLLGKTAEAEAQWAAGATTAFTDLEGNFVWAKPYVAWLESQNMAAGETATRFAPEKPCSAQMYAAFLMRALGYYEVNGDFTYANALDFAREHDVINDANCDVRDFERDDVVAASFTALAAQPKTGEADLLTRLVQDGAVDADAAAAYQKTFADYRGYAAAVKGAQKGVQMLNETAVSVEKNGAKTLDLTALDRVAVQDDELSTEGRVTLSAPGLDPYTLVRTGYYARGTYYTEENGVRICRAAELDEVLGELTAPGAVPLVHLASIEGTGSRYTLTYNETGRTARLHDLLLLESALGADALGLRELKIEKLTTTVALNRGALKTVETRVEIAGKMDDFSGVPVRVTASQRSEIEKAGASVRVTVPTDLENYLPIG